MAEVNGKLCTCDRCGKTVFLRTTGDGEADGGWTRWNKFESYPDGWEYIHEVGRVCPACSKEYRELLSRFMRNTRPMEKCDCHHEEIIYE